MMDWGEAVEEFARGNACGREAWSADDILRFHADGQLFSTVILTETDVLADDWRVLGRLQ